MATLSFLPAISISISSPRRLPARFIHCSARAGKPRASRKVMSDTDLCKGLREFVSSVGFPQDHVPSTKELTENGRKDLANIVRRRGYKFVRELLANAVCLAEEQNLPRHFEDDATGETKKLNNLTQEALGMMQGPPSGSSMEEKVEKFLEYGSLDQYKFEDDIGHNLWLNAAGGSGEYKENSTLSSSAIHHQRDSNLPSDEKESLVLNGNAVMSKEIGHPLPRRNNIWDKEASLEYPAGSGNGKDMIMETSEMENRDEVERLKNILRQKELELCQLRELFEKEKQALSTLQSEAEEEIKNAQKLISEMESELLAAEENLAGLKEVQIEYKEEAQMVDIAGSFNGWYQPIKMDPHSDTHKDSYNLRNSRLWHTSLWLYPGEYEVKFIVDGKWKVDPNREITTSDGVQNNILRVDG